MLKALKKVVKNSFVDWFRMKSALYAGSASGAGAVLFASVMATIRPPCVRVRKMRRSVSVLRLLVGAPKGIVGSISTTTRETTGKASRGGHHIINNVLLCVIIQYIIILFFFLFFPSCAADAFVVFIMIDAFLLLLLFRIILYYWWCYLFLLLVSSIDEEMSVEWMDGSLRRTQDT